MDILVVSNLYPLGPDSTHGVFVHHQVRSLRQAGHRVRVVVPVPYCPSLPSLPGAWRRFAELPTTTERDGVPVRYRRILALPGNRSKALTSYSLRASFRLFGDRFDDFAPDVVNAHVVIPSGYGAVALSDNYDVPLVTTIHGADLHSYVDLPLCDRQFETCIRASDHVVVNSTKLRSRLERQVDHTPAVTVNPNGVPLETVAARRGEDSPEPLDPDRPTVVSVGNLRWSKGHQYVIDAVAELEAVQHVVVGGGRERERLERRAETHGVSERVEFTGAVPHERVFDYLWHADVFALPSRPEAFGIVYIEAMACGIPVVGCAGQGPEDFVDDGETGLLVDPNTEAVTDAIEELLTDPERRRSMGERARLIAH